MKNFQNKYRSDSHRWQFWDYSAPSVYFITAATINREKYFGHIKNGKMKLSNFGEILNKEFQQLSKNDKIILDEYIVMPDHFHCILIIPNEGFVNPVGIQNEKRNFVKTDIVDTIHETPLRSITPLESINSLSIVSTWLPAIKIVYH